jgi:mannosyltransferase OCH1-like enzyme
MSSHFDNVRDIREVTTDEEYDTLIWYTDRRMLGTGPDILRYVIIDQLGGIYLDADCFIEVLDPMILLNFKYVGAYTKR